MISVTCPETLKDTLEIWGAHQHGLVVAGRRRAGLRHADALDVHGQRHELAAVVRGHAQHRIPDRPPEYGREGVDHPSGFPQRPFKPFQRDFVTAPQRVDPRLNASEWFAMPRRR